MNNDLNRRVLKSPPSRWSNQNEHHRYGVLNFLDGKGIKDTQEQDKIIEDFLQAENYKPKGKNHKFKKFNFIQNRFKKFTEFVTLNINK